MSKIRHRVGISAPIEVVYDALASTDGVKSWWTSDARNAADGSKKIEIFFGQPEPRLVMKVLATKENRLVKWRIEHGPKEWMKTTITFELTRDDDETVILFTHDGWKFPGAFMHHCSTKWGYFMLGLKNQLEGGSSVAFPNDLKISHWG